MTRLVKFRGLTADRKIWIYGDLLVNSVDRPMIHDGKNCLWVCPDSIGQFTGMYVHAKIPLYEGDIITVERSLYAFTCTCPIVFQNGRFIGDGFYCKQYDEPRDAFERMQDVYKIGNVHEHPERLRGFVT